MGRIMEPLSLSSLVLSTIFLPSSTKLSSLLNFLPTLIPCPHTEKAYEAPSKAPWYTQYSSPSAERANRKYKPSLTTSAVGGSIRLPWTLFLPAALCDGMGIPISDLKMKLKNHSILIWSASFLYNAQQCRHQSLSKCFQEAIIRLSVRPGKVFEPMPYGVSILPQSVNVGTTEFWKATPHG